METEGILDIGNGIHMFALKYIYALRLEVDFQAWANLHNNHGVQTKIASCNEILQHNIEM